MRNNFLDEYKRVMELKKKSSAWRLLWYVEEQKYKAVEVWAFEYKYIKYCKKIQTIVV